MNLRSFLLMPYDELEARNLEMKTLRNQRKSNEFFAKKVQDYLVEEKRLKAVNICFTDLEGKLLSLDYDKNYILHNSDSLTFDGSSVKGFSEQHKSDLRLSVDWSSFRWLPADVFGSGKVSMFANVCCADGSLHESDFRGVLQKFAAQCFAQDGLSFNVAPEIEGFLLAGVDAEQNFERTLRFEPVSQGGYFNSLPQDALRIFIDRVAEAKRSMGFENEKDHPEVAPSQFELNYKYTDPVQAADQIQIYKLLCRQVAKRLSCTASFLPKPMVGVNGSGMHVNLSVWKGDENVFSNGDKGDGGDSGGKAEGSELSLAGKGFGAAILHHAKELCLVLNSSVNSYRRLDPKFEAPNEIKMSDSDRGAMIRVPAASPRSSRVEVRSVAPDCNPYLTIFSLLKVGMLGLKDGVDKFSTILNKREKLPSNIHDAMRYFNGSSTLRELMGINAYKKYADTKEVVANRSPKELGSLVKREEVIYHHEVTNQSLWSRF